MVFNSLSGISGKTLWPILTQGFMKHSFFSTHRLSFLIPILVLIVTLVGILDQSIYNPRLNTIKSSELLGQDFVSLIIGALFIICLLFENDKFFIKVINLGILTYFIYIYSYYCFSIISSCLFLLYIIIFSLSLFILLYKLNSVIKEYSQIDTNRYYPRKTISFFFILAVIIMLVKELPYLVETTIIKNKSIILFDAFYILDLSIVFPAMIIISIINLLDKPLSIILSGIVLVKLITLMPALLFNDIFHFIKNGYFLDISFDIIATFFTLFSVSLLFLFKRGVNN